MMRFAYFVACLLTGLDQLGCYSGTRSCGLIPPDLAWATVALAFMWFIIGIYAFWWSPD